MACRGPILAVTFTHSHTAPHIGRGLSNLYSTPLSDEERAATEAYTNLVRDRVIEAVNGALESLAPAHLYYAEGTAHFAVNRRVLQDGVWTGFGVNAQGPVDHSLPVLKVAGADGQPLAILFLRLPLHRLAGITTGSTATGPVRGGVYRSGAGRRRGALHDRLRRGRQSGRDSARAFQIAQAQGREISDEVARLLSGDMREITAAVRASYGFAGLPIELSAGERTARQAERQLATGPPARRAYARRPSANGPPAGDVPHADPGVARRPVLDGVPRWRSLRRLRLPHQAGDRW